MKYQPEIHHRRSIRLKEYDYSQESAYFVTICAQHKQCLFGKIQDGIMFLNDAALMTIKWYQKLPSKFTNLQCDEFICMPNHIHFILHITDQPPVGVHPGVRPDKNHEQPYNDHPNTSIEKPVDISTIIQWYKTMTTNEYIRGVRGNGWCPFNGKLWQRNYWEHVIRNENELNQIREYIQTNPVCWEQDKLFTNDNAGLNTCSNESNLQNINPKNQNAMQRKHTVGADPCVRPIKEREHHEIGESHSKNKIETSPYENNHKSSTVGAHPRVCPIKEREHHEIGESHSKNKIETSPYENNHKSATVGAHPRVCPIAERGHPETVFTYSKNNILVSENNKPVQTRGSAPTLLAPETTEVKSS